MCCLCWLVVMKKFSIHPFSLIIWLWLCLVLGILPALSYVLAIVIHEFGHFVMAKNLGYVLTKFSISPYGFSLSYHNQNIDFRDELKIAFAGPLANFVSAFLVLAMWWLFPSTYFFTESFVVVSFVIAMFNLLPAYPLDGGRIFIDCASHFFNVKIAQKITIVFNFLLAVFFLLLFFIFLFINFNPTYMLFSCFLFVGVIDLNFVSKYEKVNIFCKQTKNFVKPVICCVYPDVTVGELIQKIQTTKTNVFCLILDNGKIVNLSEKMVIILSKKYSYEAKISDLLKKIEKN